MDVTKMDQRVYEAFFVNGHTFHMDNPHQKQSKTDLRKRLSQADITNPETEDADEKPTEEQLWKHDSFYRDTKSLLVLFQIMGVMPIERSSIGNVAI